MKLFDTIYNVLAISGEILVGTASTLLEVVFDTFTQETHNSQVYNKTEEYLNTLSYDEILDYFQHNEYLNEYSDNYIYSDRQQFIKSICNIADKENRSFTNRFDKF